MMPPFRLPLFIFFFSSLLDFGRIGLVIMTICSSSFDNEYILGLNYIRIYNFSLLIFPF